MNLTTIPYSQYESTQPQAGHHILGQLRGQHIIVYQAFNAAIARYAVANQRFGGPDYSFNRMSWIKPNFLWMMYRAGWASKENQERILAIELPLIHFYTLLEQAVYSSYQEAVYSTEANWRTALETSDVRLQWDPDHDPQGNRLARRAVQIGMKGETLRDFATKWLVSIEDITDFVKVQSGPLARHDTQNLLVMQEQVIPVANPALQRKLNLD